MRIIKLNFFLTVLLVFCFNKLTYAQCPPKEKSIKVISNYLENVYSSLKKYKPGINPKDYDFIVQRVLKDVFTSKKYPCVDAFEWNDIESVTNEVREKCYHPADYSKESNQKDLVNCAKQFFPALIIKFGPTGLSACECFSKVMIPNWDSKYKKLTKVYIEEFKTLKHRKK